LTYAVHVDYKIEIGRRIRAAREGLNLSLEELSKRTGGKLSKSRIGNYEQGLRMPGPAEANTLASALGVDAAHLLCLQRVFTDRAIILMRNWSALPEKEREEYFRRIEVLALAYRLPVPDDHLGPGWTAPKPGTTPGRKPKKPIK
jgi:transcriptional regulator with XRE-family HTH domain